jgi:hypothetical protein
MDSILISAVPNITTIRVLLTFHKMPSRSVEA